MKYLASILIVFLSFYLNAQSPELERIFAELDSIEIIHQNNSPIGVSPSKLEDGKWEWRHPEEFTFEKVEDQIKKAEQKRVYYKKLLKIDQNKLTTQERINVQIRLLQLQDQLSEVDFKTYLIPMNAEGGFYNSPSFFLPNLPFQTVQHYEAYLNWLPDYANFIAYNQSLLERGIKERIQAPKIIVENTLMLLKPWSNPYNLEENPFYKPFTSIPSSFSSGDKQRLISNGRKVLKEVMIPSYQKLQHFLESDYMASANENPGIVNRSNGKKHYEERIRYFTTLNMSPDSVFDLGLQEVTRIKSLMQEIIDELEFDGDFSAFIKFLRTDPQFYPQSGEELLHRAAWLSKKAEGQLPRLFSTLYELPFTVEPVPLEIAPTYTTGRYVGGSKGQGKPGIYWVNTTKLESRTLYTLPALTLHEAVPGHHLQISLASELEGLPEFRSNYYISAFGEGWGLYAEYLGEEMGMYETPYEWFGRYTYEMWRACRLVVDVGIHYKNWSRDKAIQFMADNTALSIHEVNTEIDRYIGWPGQAVSYKIGEITIKQLRKEAEEALGEDFDIQAFHEVILRNGSIPLTALREEVRRFINK